MTAVLWTYQVIDANSRVVPRARVSLMQGFRKGPVWHDPEMRTPARNPYPTDGAGRVALYLKAGETYEITIETPRGERQQFTHVARADGDVIRETVTERIEVPVERVVYQDNPETLRRLVEMEAMLAAAAAPKPEPVAANPPAEAVDLIDWSAAPKDRQEALLVKLREINGLIGLAEDRGGRAEASLYRRRDAIDSGIRYNRATLAETI